MDYIRVPSHKYTYRSWIHFTHQIVGYWLQPNRQPYQNSEMQWHSLRISKRNAEMKWNGNSGAALRSLNFA
jgi:hypothetical protein